MHRSVRANSLLISSGAGVLLGIPVDDDNSSLAATFHDRLARAYVYDEGDDVKKLLRDEGSPDSALSSGVVSSRGLSAA